MAELSTQGQRVMLIFMKSSKDNAHEFLSKLEQTLADQLPPAAEMEPWIRRTVREAHGEHVRRHLHGPEGAFLNGLVLPALSQLVRRDPSCCSDDRAKQALLNEYHPSMPEISSHTPARTARHPFTKILGANAQEVYSRWADEKNGSSLVQSCPDFALRDPFPHKIVFEGKYFSNGSDQYAQRALVENLYQAFFYRGLPYVPETARGRAAWDYDYACLLAYDGSPTGSLRNAWKSLPLRVKHDFWTGANIYVMILGGQGRAKSP
jgi:hypothetical protein